MTRILMACLFAGSCLAAVPNTSQAGIIPWMYDSIFGYGPAFGGYRTAYYGGGYAPAYPASYSYPAYGGYGYGGGGCSSCGVTANYAPSYGAYYGGYGGYDMSYGGSGCCAPCNSCAPCGGGCNTGCSSCGGGGCSTCGTPGGGDCSTGSNSYSTPTAPPTNSSSGRTPTYADPADRSNEPPADEFTNAKNRLNEGKVPRAGSGGTGAGGSGFETPGFGSGADGSTLQPDRPMNPGFSNPGSNLGPAPAEPAGAPMKDPDANLHPKLGPVDLDAKVAFTAAPKLGRQGVVAKFRLPTIVRTPARVHHDAAIEPAVVASK
jgi:hypothetical protein